jgi:hypothetical protein
MHEFLDCALSFWIKSIITLSVSAGQHAFNFYSICAMIFNELQTTQKQEENLPHILRRVRGGSILS